jgi:dienelactone hydrolase
MVRRTALVLGACLLVAAQSHAQEPVRPGARPAPSPEAIRAMREADERNKAMPDTPGTGPFPALKEQTATLPDHVIYRPANLVGLGRTKLGVVAWGNGGCNDDGANARQHLSEIASHGYLVIASGTIKSGPGAPPQPPETMPSRGPNGELVLPPARTTPAMLTAAIDWALAENLRKGSPYFGRIDPSAVAVSGWSCGGLQALAIAASDRRVKTAIIHNSGTFPEPGANLRTGADKTTIDKLHAPLIYILGGPSDIAYANGMDDFARITKVPVAVANLAVGHGGTFYQPNGGKVAPVAVAWLAWRLRGDEAAGKWFKVPDCRLCRDSEWQYQQKGL